MSKIFAEKILVISGATASGKSQLALELAEKYGAIIINADSMQIFSGLPILSAQPSPDCQRIIPHRLYGKIACNQTSSVAKWLDFASQEIRAAWNLNKMPIIVGGTGFYISSLVKGLSSIPAIDEKYRLKAEEILVEIGLEEFRKKFGEEKIIDRNRLIRACEVFLQTQKPISFWQKQPPKILFSGAKIMHFNLNLPREKIYQNCNFRFQQMLENGAIEEVSQLIKNLPDFQNFPISKTLGFNEIVEYLSGAISAKEMEEKAAQKTRNYAKRQLTWFRHQFGSHEIFYVEKITEILELLRQKL